MMQHYGGLTNRIDFTIDYLIALFFACQGSTDKNGRIIALERDKFGYHLRYPQSPNNRIMVQKSVFVIHHEGFIDIKQDGIVIINIPKDLKPYILRFLRKHHGISIETIYADFAGSIRLQHDNLKATSYYLHGNDYLLKDQYDLAINKFNEAIKVGSNHAEAYQGRGIANIHKNEDDLAIENLTEAIEMSQYNAKSYLSRGNVYAKIGDYKQAIADFEKADQVQIPRDDVVLPRIHLSLGNAHAKSENYDEAIKIFEHAIRILPDFQDPSGWRPSNDTHYIAAALRNSLGNIFTKIGEDYRSIACFKEAMNFNENNFLSYLNLSTVYMKINERENAVNCYEKLIATMLKSNFATYLCRGHFYAKIGEYEKAIEDFNETIEILITHLDKTREGEDGYDKWAVAAFYNRHNSYSKIGNTEKANEDFNKAKELDPELTEDSRPRFLFPMPVLVRQPDIYLCPALHSWEVDLSPDFEE